ncbi:GatB/YqeY domain-containing protein [Actinopolymorpha alba]|uniref:GatB/YqeY domain-containing protein n=1 Tax=Actinopolymorpha alba TaxID=533267 RepID=UPI000375139C|nr:GatB/YqeY domain-containing protein [Actinopolymorpha alba]
MSALKDRLRADLTAAMKARDSLRASTLRMTLTEVTNAEVAGTAARELSDAEVLEVLDKEAKKRREAAEAFDQAGRAELAAKERTEGEIIAEYLPVQLSEDELAEIVRTAIAEVGASGMKDMGAVMKIVQPQVKGRAEGGRIAAVVRGQLS